MTQIEHLPAFRIFYLVAFMLTWGSCSQVQALTINLTYDSSVTSLSNAAQYESAINYAVQRLQGLITSPITVNITVYAVSNASYLGEGGPYYYDTYYDYAKIRSALASYDSLPLSDPTPSGGLYVIPNAEAKALGLIGASSATDGSFTINTSFSYSFDPNNRAEPNEYDLIGVAEHEITHAMGRVSALGNLDGYQLYYPYDLFRYSSSGAKTMVWGYEDYFSINGGATNLQTYDSYSDPADWWSNAIGDAFIAFTPTDVQNGLSQTDFDVMYVLGYSENTATVIPSITSSTSAVAQAGQPFSYTITASNGPISFGVTSGLPSWLSVNQSTGVISGTPPTTGSYSMTIVAGNAQGPANATLTINVGTFVGASLYFQNGTSLGILDLNTSFLPSSWQGIGTMNNGWQERAIADINGDGIDDIIFQNGTLIGALIMNANRTANSWVGIGSMSSGWQLRGAGYITDDGNLDLIFQNGTLLGYLEVNTSGVPVSWNGIGAMGTGWELRAVATLDGTGQPDLIFQNGTVLGALQVNTSGVPMAWNGIGALNTGWTLSYAVDVTGDGQPDLIFQDGTSLGALSVNTSFQPVAWYGIGAMGSGWVLPGDY